MSPKPYVYFSAHSKLSKSDQTKYPRNRRLRRSLPSSRVWRLSDTRCVRDLRPRHGHLRAPDRHSRFPGRRSKVDADCKPALFFATKDFRTAGVAPGFRSSLHPAVFIGRPSGCCNICDQNRIRYSIFNLVSYAWPLRSSLRVILFVAECCSSEHAFYAEE